jgi:hypothetical protein
VRYSETFVGLGARVGGPTGKEKTLHPLLREPYAQGQGLAARLPRHLGGLLQQAQIGVSRRRQPETDPW